MADETKIEAEAAVQAPAKVAEAVADTVQTIAKESVKTAKRSRAATARRPEKIVTRRAKIVRRKTRTAARKPAAAKQRIETMTNTNFFKNFEAVPAFAPFQTLFADAGERGQELVKKSQKVAEELADLTRANVEAIVESGRVAAEGARSIGQDVVAISRDGVEQAADAIRSLTEAKSPTEFIQLQSELARTSFDRARPESREGSRDRRTDCGDRRDPWPE